MSRPRLWLSFAAGATLSILAAAAPLHAQHTVGGRFIYEDRPFDSKGFLPLEPRQEPAWRGIPFATVEIRGAGNVVRGTGTTNEIGEFSFQINSSAAETLTAWCLAKPNLADGPNFDVRRATTTTNTDGPIYALSSDSVATSGQGAVWLGATFAGRNLDVAKAFNIYECILGGLQFIASPKAHGRYPTSKLTVTWSPTVGDNGSFFSSARQQIYMGSNAGYDDSVVFHELGHYVDRNLSKSSSPGGSHFLGDGNQDIRLSWGEGLATFLGSCMMEFLGYLRPDLYVRTDGTALSFSYEIESLTRNSSLMASSRGSTNEIAVTAALWDIVDGPGTTDGTPGTDDDPLTRPFADVWRVLIQYMPTVASAISVEDFWTGWFAPSINLGFLREMITVFSTLNGIDLFADLLEPDNTPSQAPLIALSRLSRGEGQAKVLISEIDPGTVDALELYNAGTEEADLTGWRVIATAPGFTTAFYTLPSFRLAPGAHVILSEASGVNTSTVLYFNSNINWAHGSAGACSLTTAAGQGIDFVRWGDSTEPPPGGISFTGPNPPAIPSNMNLARLFASPDHNWTAEWKHQQGTLGTHNLGGYEMRHTIYPVADSDVAAFDAVSGTEYSIETLAHANGIRTIIEVLAPDGLKSLAASANSSGIHGVGLRWRAPAGGRHYIRVARPESAANFAKHGSYSLRVSAKEILSVSASGGARYRRIEDALAAAVSGDTIEIRDSETYRENLLVSKAGITIRAARGFAPILDGAGAPDRPAIEIAAPDSRLEALRIRGGLPGVLVRGGVATIVNVVVYAASGGASAADGIRVSGATSRARLVHCTVTQNARVGVGVFEGGTAEVVNSIVSGNQLEDVFNSGGSGKVTVRHSLVGTPGYAGADGNVEGAPRFQDLLLPNFQLTANSPALDAGDPSDPEIPPADADGLPRILDGKGSGSAKPDLGAYEFIPPARLASLAVLPQIAVGGGYQTSLIAVNTGKDAAVARIEMIDSTAQPIQNALRNRPGGTLLAAVPPMGSMRLKTDTAPSSARSGYARVLADRALDGSAIFKLLDGPEVLSEAGTGLARAARNFTIYIDEAGDSRSGYAVANPGTDGANLTLTLRRKDGTTAGTKSLSLAPGNHIARFAWQEFPSAATPGFEGSLEFASDRVLYAVALRYDNLLQDVFCTIPILAEETASEVYFPQVADGGGYRTNIILVNPAAAGTTAVIEFFDSDGKPLLMPIAGALRSSLEVTLNAKGVASLLTDGTSGGTKTGWARVRAPHAIGGSAIFQTLSSDRITSQAGVRSSPAAKRFAVFVDSVGFAESGLAVANPSGSAVTFALYLRNTRGEIAAAHNITLPAFGHTARFFTEWFPTAFGEFEGTLEVAAESPVTGVALRYDNFLANVFSALPVILVP